MMDLKDRQIFDITMNLNSEFLSWPGDLPGRIVKTSALSRGDNYNSSSIQSSLHWGTHIDAPYHLCEEKWTIDQIPLNILMGKVRILEIPREKKITADILKKQPIENEKRILIKTRNSKFWENSQKFRKDFSALTPDAAELLVELGIKLVGIDYFSMDLYEADDLPVHRILCQHNIIGVELLDLREIDAGHYNLVCLPLKIQGGDGAPARVLLTR
jgi:arylformamidase